ncbi:MAG: hypothetical protein RLZZ252_532 [Bacteroidota bacterium]|jgi:hypothetical protein
MTRRGIPFLLVLIAVWSTTASAQSFINSQCNISPKKNPRGLNQELDNSSFETGWKLLRWDSLNIGYTTNDTMPFSWKVNGNSYSVFKGISNGSITFSTNPLPSVTHLFQTTNLPDPQLAELSLGFYGLIAKGSNDQIFTKTYGASPNRQFWIKFHSFSVPSDSITGYSSYATVALVIEENSGAVHFVQMNHGNLTGIPFNNQKRAALTMGANWGAFDGTTITDENADNVQINYMPAPMHTGVGDNRYFTLYPKSQYPQFNDGILIAANLNPNSGYVKEDAEITIPFAFAARGLAKPNTLSVKVKLGNKSIETYSLDTFSTPDIYGVYRGTITLSSTGLNKNASHNVTLWLENSVAGESDKTNDSLYLGSIIIQDQFIQVTGYPCLEVFTGNWDHNSALLDVQLQNLKKSNPLLQNSIILMHHVLDPMATEAADLLNKINGGIAEGVFPAMSFNRGYFEENPANSIFGIDSLQQKIANWKIYNTFLVPQIENLKYDAQSKKVTGTYKISALDYFDPSTVRVTVFLREKNQRGNTSGWLQRMSLEETQKPGSYFFGKGTKMVGYPYNDVAFDWSSEGNGIMGKPLGTSQISTPGVNFSGPIDFTLPDSAIKVTFPKSVDFADSGDAFLRYKPADLEVVVIVTDDRLNSISKRAEMNIPAPIVTAAIQPVWDVNANIAAVQKLELSAYPNPTSDRVWIKCNQAIKQIVVTDIQGKVQETLNVFDLNSNHENLASIDLGSKAAGVYLITVLDTMNRKQTMRIVKGY